MALTIAVYIRARLMHANVSIGARTMSRKDFNLIAETIRLLPSFETHQADGKLYPCEVVNFCAVVSRFAEALRQTNPSFNTQRFINACNGKAR